VVLVRKIGIENRRKRMRKCENINRVYIKNRLMQKKEEGITRGGR
jgi:hypothetical protein